MSIKSEISKITSSLTQSSTSSTSAKTNTTSSSSSSSMSFQEKAAIEIAKGLVATGVEGPYETCISSSAGDYPSIGCSCWEGNRADTLLNNIGLSKYAGKSFSSLTPSDISTIKQALGSEKGKSAQLAILSSDASSYVNAILAKVSITEIRCLIYAGIWCPTSTSAVCSHLGKNSGVVNNLEQLNQAFINDPGSYALTTANVGNTYAEGYRNRGNKTYNYCKGLNESDLGKCDASTLSQIQSSLSAFGSFFPGASSAANMEVTVDSMPPHGKHTDTVYKSPDKLYCEPIYDDLIWIKGKTPDDVLENVTAKAPASNLTTGKDLVYSASEETTIAYSDSNYQNYYVNNKVATEQRNEAFDFDNLTQKVKVPSGGKPSNDKDPFPVDSKIKELEEHQPRVKISSIKSCPEAMPVTKECIKLSMNVERRLVRIENNLSTIMRYLWRVGARMPVNCVYYGGQNIYDRYKCIRCLKDNRIEDGQMMSFDQCMNCTKYEPIIGQVYDILNETGLNLSMVLDECQMGYMTTDDYIRFAKPDKLQKDLPMLKEVGFATKSVRDANYANKDFNEEWTDDMGVKMNWSLTPVENQKPSINGTTETLPSNVDTKTNSGSAMTSTQAVGESISSTATSTNNAFTNSAKEINNLETGHFAESLSEKADEWMETYKDVYLADMNRSLCNNITELLKEKNIDYIDNLLVCAIVCASNRDANLVISDIEGIHKSLKANNIDNDVLTVLFHNLDTNCLYGSNSENIGDKTFPRRLDKVTKIIETESGEGN